MKISGPLPDNKKLTVTFRVEPGCLGPEGSLLINEFCDYAQQRVRSLDAEYVIWNIVPRSDKKLPEIQYHALGKQLGHAQADKYLRVFGKSLDEFEGHLDDRVAHLIEEFSVR